MDPKNWSLTDSYGRDACFGGGNQEQQCYSEDHSTIRLLEGHLALIAHPADNLPNGKSFKSARIQSRGKLDIRYGRIEASLKLPFGQGVCVLHFDAAVLADHMGTGRTPGRLT